MKTILLGLAILFCVASPAFAEKTKSMSSKTVAYGKPVKVAKNEAVVFPDFVFKSLGHESKSDPKGPTVSLESDNYAVTELNGKDQVVSVEYTQNAPEPVDFKVDRMSFTLHTFALPNGNRLGKDEVAIFPKSAGTK